MHDNILAEKTYNSICSCLKHHISTCLHARDMTTSLYNRYVKYCAPQNKLKLNTPRVTGI